MCGRICAFCTAYGSPLILTSNSLFLSLSLSLSLSLPLSLALLLARWLRGEVSDGRLVKSCPAALTSPAGSPHIPLSLTLPLSLPLSLPHSFSLSLQHPSYCLHPSP